MKRSFRVLGILALASGLAFSSCKKDIETSDLTLDLTKKATVTAYFYAETDNQTQGLEFAKEGTKVIVSIDNSEFNSSASGEWTDTATIAAGKITVEIPATSTGVTVNFYPAEFTAEQTQPYGSNVAKINKIFKLAGGTSLGGVKAGEVRTHQATYDAGVTFDNYAETVKISFIAKAIIDENTATQFITTGTIITISNSNWTTTATVSAGGRFDVNFPKGMPSKATFIIKKTLIAPDQPKDYKYEHSFVAYNATTPVNENIDFGGGVLWQ